jgi:hypothetical protein
MSDGTVEYAAFAESGLRKLPLYNGQILFRGCEADIVKYYKLEPGEVFQDKAFLSKYVYVKRPFLRRPSTSRHIFSSK